MKNLPQKILPFLKRISRLFLRLQWKLTLLYTLVTVAVLLILISAAVFLSNQMVYSVPMLTANMADALSLAAQDLAPALSAQPVDADAAEAWVDKVFDGRMLFISSEVDEGDDGPADTQEISYSFTSMASKNTFLVVADPQGHVIASNHPERWPAGKPVTAEASPAGLNLLRQALGGERDARKLWSREENRQIAAAPIHQSGRLLGVALVVLERPNQLDLLISTLLSVAPTVAPLTLVAGLIGMVFGALTARSLVKRIKGIMHTTDAWGQGDFRQRLQDRSADEVGLLAQDLNQMADELQNLMQTRQDLAALEERNRLARDLHDSVKQQVFAVSMNLAAAQALWERDPQAARQRLDIATEVSRQTQQELTTLIQTLRPPQLSEKSLSAALDELVRQWARQNNCRAAFRVEGSPQPLHPETEQAFFRMAQEALSNIARHSRASMVEMALIFNHDTAALEVRDDGQGFDPNQPVSGLGLRSMRERIHALGGVFSVESRPGSTHLSAQIPVLSPDRNTEVKHE